MTGVRAARTFAWAGLLALQLLIARTYLVRGTWWHWLLHVPIGIGVGLAAGALAGAWRPGRAQPVLGWALAGELVSLIPDLMFRFLRMPHELSMDVFLGHISVHRGPSPVLVALTVLLLGGWAFVAGTARRRRTAVALAVATLGLLLVACLLAAPLPTRLAQLG